MIPGYNSGVMFAGIEYHVQTEDLGAKTASILTLVYRGGAIVARQKTGYRDPAGEIPSAEAIKRLIDEQHQDFKRRAAAGEFAETVQPAPSAPSAPPAPPDPAPAPAPAKPELDIDHLIADYLRRRAARQARS